MSSTPLRVRTKLAFGVGAVAEAATYIAFNTWNLLFYNHVLGLSGTLCGLAVMISLVLDGFADPVVGFISDGWRSKLGRRHPFLYASALPLGASFFCIYSPPAGLQGMPLFFWFTFFTVLFRQCWTLFQVPHLALGAELSDDYRERTVVMSYNALFQVVGGAGAFLLGWTWLSHAPGGSGVRTGYSGLGAGVAVVSTLTILAAAHFTRDQIPRLKQPLVRPRQSLLGLLGELRSCLSNRNYLAMVFGMICFGALVGTRETLASYTSLFYWGLPEDKIRLYGLASPPVYILAFFVTARLHDWFDKRRTIIVAMAVMAFAITYPIAARMLGHFPANGSRQLFPALLAFYALGYLAIAVLTISVMSALADIADEHELLTGRRQEGVFYSARTLFGKITAGLGTLCAGAAIDLIHFPQGAKPGEVSADVLYKLGWIDGPIASLPAFIAIFCLARYNIDRRRHAEIQSQLLERRKQAIALGESEAPVAIEAHAVG
jgi:Na+/melibiose symporter-like transporter